MAKTSSQWWLSTRLRNDWSLAKILSIRYWDMLIKSKINPLTDVMLYTFMKVKIYIFMITLIYS